MKKFVLIGGWGRWEEVNGKMVIDCTVKGYYKIAESNDRDDLMQDFVSIITSFCARLYGLRRNKRRTEKIIEQLSKED